MELADPKYKFDDTFTVKGKDNEKFAKVLYFLWSINQINLSKVENDVWSLEFDIKFIVLMFLRCRGCRVKDKVLGRPWKSTSMTYDIYIYTKNNWCNENAIMGSDGLGWLSFLGFLPDAVLQSGEQKSMLPCLSGAGRILPGATLEEPPTLLVENGFARLNSACEWTLAIGRG